MSRFKGSARPARPAAQAQDAILDGELVCLDQEIGKPLFHELLGGGGPCAYAVFDLLWLNGRDLRPLPLWRRKKALLKLIPRNRGVLLRVKSWKGKGIELSAATQELDLEGVRGQAQERFLDLPDPLVQDQEPELQPGGGSVRPI
jgi:ATP-dependent DNA ligase